MNYEQRLGLDASTITSALTLGMQQSHSSELLSEYRSAQKSLADYLTKRPPVDQEAKVRSMADRSRTFLKELTSSDFIVPWLLMHTTCRLVTVSGKTTESTVEIPSCDMSVDSLKIVTIGGMNDERLRPSCRSPRIYEGQSATTSTFIECSAWGGRRTYSVRGEFTHLINSNLILNHRSHNMLGGSFRKYHTMLLPVHGDHLSYHPKVKRIVDSYLQDVPSELMLELATNDERRQKVENLQASLTAKQDAISCRLAGCCDFLEIMETHQSLSNIYKEEKEAIHFFLGRRLSNFDRIPPKYRPIIETFFDLLNGVLDDDDRALVWIGISRGMWEIPTSLIRQQC
ncbi:hypothetical protein [Acetobacter malorum]|nr:hypothetical protein [Acetobacter malorum]